MLRSVKAGESEKRRVCADIMAAWLFALPGMRWICSPFALHPSPCLNANSSGMLSGIESVGPLEENGAKIVANLKEFPESEPDQDPASVKEAVLK